MIRRVAAIVVKANGPHFSSGHDISVKPGEKPPADFQTKGLEAISSGARPEMRITRVDATLWAAPVQWKLSRRTRGARLSDHECRLFVLCTEARR